MIQNVTKSCRELAKYVRIKETLLNAAGVARGPRAGETRGGVGPMGRGWDNFLTHFCRIGNKHIMMEFYDAAENIVIFWD